MPDSKYELLFLDFDGVIVDSTKECAALTWYAGKDVTNQTLSSLLSVVPDWFDQRFRYLRPYMRTLDDFLVSRLISSDIRVESQDEFLELRSGIDASAIEDFVQDANALRSYWRSHDYRTWLGSHVIFDGIHDLLERYSKRVYMVTAKDTESSQDILDHFGLEQHISGIIGEAHDKALAVNSICLGRYVDPRATLFIDDNIVNCVRVSGTGATVNWAAWGWTSLAHFEAAGSANLAKLEMADMMYI